MFFVIWNMKYAKRFSCCNWTVWYPAVSNQKSHLNTEDLHYRLLWTNYKLHKSDPIMNLHDRWLLGGNHEQRQYSIRWLLNDTGGCWVGPEFPRLQHFSLRNLFQQIFSHKNGGQSVNWKGWTSRPLSDFTRKLGKGQESYHSIHYHCRS